MKRIVRQIINGPVTNPTIIGGQGHIRITLVAAHVTDNNGQTNYPQLRFIQAGTPTIVVPCGVGQAAAGYYITGGIKMHGAAQNTVQTGAAIYGVAGTPAGGAMAFSLPDTTFEQAVGITVAGADSDSLEVGDLLVEYEEDVLHKSAAGKERVVQREKD
jgi:hypothetical protein